MDAERREMFRAMDEAWPTIEALERRFRRTDLWLLAMNVVAAVVLITAINLSSTALLARACFTGSLFSVAFALGIHWTRLLDRRRHFRAMSEAHEVIGLELHYHDDE